VSVIPTSMTPLRTSIAGSPEFRRRFLRLVAAQLDGQTCGLAEMAAELLSEAPDLHHETTVYQTLEGMLGRKTTTTGLARDDSRARRTREAAQRAS
jgi:hypothetical protein